MIPSDSFNHDYENDFKAYVAKIRRYRTAYQGRRGDSEKNAVKEEEEEDDDDYNEDNNKYYMLFSRRPAQSKSLEDVIREISLKNIKYK